MSILHLIVRGRNRLDQIRNDEKATFDSNSYSLTQAFSMEVHPSWIMFNKQTYACAWLVRSLFTSDRSTLNKYSWVNRLYLVFTLDALLLPSKQMIMIMIIVMMINWVYFYWPYSRTLHVQIHHIHQEKKRRQTFDHHSRADVHTH